MRMTSAIQALYVGPPISTGGHFYFSGNSAGSNADATRTGDGVGPGNISGWNLINQLHRIQSCNYSWGVNRVNVNQFGETAAIDRVILESPTVSLSFNYLLANMYNESGMGFHTQGLYNCVSGFANKNTDDRNYFLRISPEGVDAVGSNISNPFDYVVGFGNGFLSSYTTQGAVNSFPTVDVGVEFLNMTVDTGISGLLPAIIPSNGNRMPSNYRYFLPPASGSAGTGFLDISVLRPGDITFSIKQREADDEGTLSSATSTYSSAGVNISDAHVQSYNINFGLSRQQILKLGTKYAISREINWPIDCTWSVDGLVTSYITGSLDDMASCDQAFDLEVNILNPACPTETARSVVARYIGKNFKLNSHSYSSAIGNNKKVTLNFAGQIGSAQQANVGLFMSGISSATAT